MMLELKVQGWETLCVKQIGVSLSGWAGRTKLSKSEVADGEDEDTSLG